MDDPQQNEHEQFLKPMLPITAIKKQTATDSDQQIPQSKANIAKQQQEIELRYTEPDWARIPTSSSDDFYIEIIKNGAIIDRITLHNEQATKSFLAIGRFDPCEIKLEHPSVSRFHAILQYGECIRGKPQWCIYDLNSTHGVRLNKNLINKNKFVPLFAGYFFQIAGSSRIFVFSGGPEEKEQEEIIAKTPETTMKQETNKDDKDQEEEESHKFYEKDPLYWLERYFEREGMPMNFNFTKTKTDSLGLGLATSKKKSKSDEDSATDWICSIELVSDVSLNGGTMVSASAPNKRLAQVQCALLACERLDEASLLQITSLWNKRTTYAENDFYEEDEDTFFDRTGQIEEQREKRKRRYEGDPMESQMAKSYNDLLKEIGDVEGKIEVIKSEIERLTGKDKYSENGDDDSNKTVLNFSTRMAISQMKNKEKKLLEERSRLSKMAAIAKPSHTFALPSKITKHELKCETREEEQQPAEPIKSNLEKIVAEPIALNIKNEEKDQQSEEQPLSGVNIESVKIKQEDNQNATNEKPIDVQKEEIASTSNQQSQMDKSDEPVEQKEERFYAPAMPSKLEAQAIAPKFGILTKEELVQMKLMQRQREKERDSNGGADKRPRMAIGQSPVDEEEQIYSSMEKYATWLPPEDQTGDGSTKLNRKFAGKY